MTTSITPQQTALESKLITVASGKGGVGKTWFAATLGHTLARQGRKVLLFDGDLGLANIDIQLGLTPSRDVGDVISGACELSAAITQFNDTGSGEGSFDIIAGRSGSGALGTMARQRLSMLKSGLTAIAAQYDHVILDLAAGVDADVLTLSDQTGPLMVILTPDPTALTDAYALVKLTHMRDPKADIRIVVNMAEDKRAGEKAYEAILKACEGFLNISPPLVGIIKTDKKVVDAIRHQSALLSRHPQAEAVEAVAEIAKTFPAQAKALAG